MKTNYLSKEQREYLERWPELANCVTNDDLDGLSTICDDLAAELQAGYDLMKTMKKYGEEKKSVTKPPLDTPVAMLGMPLTRTHASKLNRTIVHYLPGKSDSHRVTIRDILDFPVDLDKFYRCFSPDDRLMPVIPEVVREELYDTLEKHGYKYYDYRVIKKNEKKYLADLHEIPERTFTLLAQHFSNYFLTYKDIIDAKIDVGEITGIDQYDRSRIILAIDMYYGVSYADYRRKKGLPLV